MSYKPRLHKVYKEQIVPKLMEQFQYKSIMQVPKLEKICLNQGVGARISVSNFKLREGMTIGTRVTLRKDRMMEFLDRLVNVALPRVRDFRGINDKSFDGRGNYSMGITEQIVFPEIDLDKINKITGMDITFVTTANTDEEAYALLSAFGLPFKNARNN